MIDFATSTPVNVPHQYHHLERELKQITEEAIDKCNTEYSNRHMHIVLMIFILKKVYPMVSDDEEALLMTWWIRQCRDPENREPFEGLYTKFNKLLELKWQWRQRLQIEDVPFHLLAANAIRQLVCAQCKRLRDEWKQKIPSMQMDMRIDYYLAHIESFLSNHVIHAIYFNNVTYPANTLNQSKYHSIERTMQEDISIYASQHNRHGDGKMLFQIVLMIFMLRKVVPLVQNEGEEEDLEWWVEETHKTTDRDPLVGLYKEFVEMMKVNDHWRGQTNLGDVAHDRTPIKAIEQMVCSSSKKFNDEWDELINPFQHTHSIPDVLQRIESLLRNGGFIAIYNN